jgi:hypothetical protein
MRGLGNLNRSICKIDRNQKRSIENFHLFFFNRHLEKRETRKVKINDTKENKG